MQVADNINFEYKISNVSYDDTSDIKFYIDEANIEVLYGPLKKDQVNDKLLYLKEIINKSKSQGLKGYLDISADNYYEKAVLNSEI